MQPEELIAAILSFWCVVLAAKNSIWNWPVAMMGSIIYVTVFFKSGLYSDAILNVVFVFFQLHGWIGWRKNSLALGQFKPSFGPSKSVLKVLFVALLIYPFWVYLVSAGFGNAIAALFSGADFLNSFNTQGSIVVAPRFIYVDAMLLLLSLSALFMQSKKWIQNWILWIAIDVIYVPVYWLNQNYITAVLYLIYIPLAVKGYQMWVNESKEISLGERSTID